MSIPFVLACLWFIGANVAGMIPSRDHHWRRAYVLIALGVPLLGWLTWAHGPWAGLAALAAGASILRWPLRFLGRWLRRSLSRRPEPAE